MGDHVRTQIRDFVKTTLTGMTTTGSNVFKTRFYPLEQADLPGLIIFSGPEGSSKTTLTSVERTYTVIVEVYASANIDVDDTLDTACKEIEAALFSDTTFGGLCKFAELTSTDFEQADEFKKPTMRVTLTIDVGYKTTQTAPDVAL